MKALSFSDLPYQVSILLSVVCIVRACAYKGFDASVSLVRDFCARREARRNAFVCYFEAAPSESNLVDENLLPQFSGMQMSRAEMLVQAARDTLTDLLNRPAIMYLLSMELRLIHTDRTLLAVVLIDIDHLKTVNEIHGYEAGDETLRVFSRAVRSGIQPCDFAGRYGDDEFIVLISDFLAVDIEARLNSLHQKIAHVQVPIGEQLVELRCSLGVIFLTPASEPLNLDLALSRAERQLVRAKNGGRNRLCYRWYLA